MDDKVGGGDERDVRESSPQPWEEAERRQCDRAEGDGREVEGSECDGNEGGRGKATVERRRRE